MEATSKWVQGLERVLLALCVKSMNWIYIIKNPQAIRRENIKTYRNDMVTI